MSAAAFPAPHRVARAGWRTLAAAALVIGAAWASAAPIQRSAGDGLTYVRVHQVPADLPAEQAIRKTACVLDLRYATGDAVAADLLRAWLRFHSSATSPVLVLVNSSTAAPLQSALAERALIPGLLTVGLASQRLPPDITVNETSENERLAYDALEKGATIATLTTDHPEKQRNDEASLAHDRAPVDGADTDSPTGRKKGPAPLIDPTLQRAIQIYRGLVAMKAVPKPAPPAAK